LKVRYSQVTCPTWISFFQCNPYGFRSEQWFHY